MAAPSPSYLTATEAKELTLVQAIKDASDADLNPFLLRAEQFIDDEVGPRPHHEDDSNTHRVFPRPQDEDSAGTPIIPQEIKTATLYILEQLYLKGAPQSYEDFTGELESENMTSGGGYSYRRKSNRDQEQSLIPPAARKLLRNFLPGAIRISTDTTYADS